MRGLHARAALLGQFSQHFFAGGNHFPFPLRGGLLVVLAFLQLGEHAGFFTLPLKTAERVFEGFIFLDVYQWHLRLSPPSRHE